MLRGQGLMGMDDRLHLHYREYNTEIYPEGNMWKFAHRAIGTLLVFADH